MYIEHYVHKKDFVNILPIISTQCQLSVTFSSPEALLAEVILVDDASTMEHLGKDLEDYMAQYPKAKIRS